MNVSSEKEETTFKKLFDFKIDQFYKSRVFSERD